MRFTVVALTLVMAIGTGGQAPPGPGVRLGERTWTDAEKLLRADAVVVIPIGGALQQHGPHLPLQSDLILAEYFAGRLATAAAVVVASGPVSRLSGVPRLPGVHVAHARHWP